jgi:serine/threonine protein kinase
MTSPEFESVTESVKEPPNESQETRRFDSDQIRAISMPRAGLVLRERYRLDSEIGRGAMGIVFRATDLELLRPVAVKILAERLSGHRTTQDAGAPTVAGESPAAADATGTSDQRSRFMREARAAAALNHPHIVGIYDVGEDHGFPFFVMELVDGPNLGQAPPLDLHQVVEFACQICAALEHAHANNIVHRDLKPANVLLSGVPPSFAKLADLGLALPASGSRISHAGTIVGTAAYMAPEQALGKIVDGRADLYALGVVLYELTTGRVPFPGNDPLATISQHLHAPVVPPRVLRPDLPRALETIILRLLAKDPAQRFATAGETATALREALAATL